MKYQYDLVIIGGGSAGLVAAEAAPRMGVKAALVERGQLGGDCLWTGCVPSKALLASAKAAQTIRESTKYGLPAIELDIDTSLVWRRLHDIQESIAATDESSTKFADLGVDLIQGQASFVDEHTIRVDQRVITAKFYLVCTGSRPACPPIEGIEDVGYLTSENVFGLEEAPRSLIIVGAGPIGIEMAQAMNRLGVQTTLLEAGPRILIREEPILADALRRTLEDEGVLIQTGVEIARAELVDGKKVVRGKGDAADKTWTADEILVAAGRRPTISSLGLERLGVRTAKKGIGVNANLRTSVKSIYAAGDCTGRFYFTHNAAAEALIAMRNMFYPGSQRASEVVPWTTFTDPELAHVGMTSEEARSTLGVENVCVWRQDLVNSDRARAEGATTGAVMIVTDRKLRVLGAHVLAPGAGELIGQMTSAISRKARLTPEIVNVQQVYPTYSTAISRLAADATYIDLEKPLLRTLRRLSTFFGG